MNLDPNIRFKWTEYAPSLLTYKAYSIQAEIKDNCTVYWIYFNHKLIGITMALHTAKRLAKQHSRKQN